MVSGTIRKMRRGSGRLGVTADERALCPYWRSRRPCGRSRVAHGPISETWTETRGLVLYAAGARGAPNIARHPKATAVQLELPRTGRRLGQCIEISSRRRLRGRLARRGRDRPGRSASECARRAIESIVASDLGRPSRFEASLFHGGCAVVSAAGSRRISCAAGRRSRSGTRGIPPPVGAG